MRTNHDDRQRKPLIVTLALLLVAAAVLTFFSLPGGGRKKPLLARATRLFGLFGPDLPNSRADYEWISSSELIVRITETQTLNAAPRGAEIVQNRLYRVRAGGGDAPETTPMALPSPDRPGEPVFSSDLPPWGGDLSPDGRWMLQLQYVDPVAVIGHVAARAGRDAGFQTTASGFGGGGSYIGPFWPELPPKAAIKPARETGLRRVWKWVAVSLNDGRKVWTEADDPYDPSFFGFGRAIWLPDSSGWMRVRALPGRRVELHVWRLDGTRTVLPVAGRFPAGEHYQEAAGVTRDGRLVLLSAEQGAVALTEIGPATAGTARLRALPPWTPPRPQGRMEYAPTLSDVNVSPDGNRVAYCLTYQTESLLRRELRASFSGIGPEPRVAELWVARINGAAQQRCLGSVTPGGLRQVRWTPDGKRLSFVSGGGLYLLPADADD